MYSTISAQRQALAKILAALVLAAGVLVTSADIAYAKGGADDPPHHEKHHGKHHR